MKGVLPAPVHSHSHSHSYSGMRFYDTYSLVAHDLIPTEVLAVYGCTPPKPPSSSGSSRSSSSAGVQTTSKFNYRASALAEARVCGDVVVIMLPNNNHAHANSNATANVNAYYGCPLQLRPEWLQPHGIYARCVKCI